MLHVRGECRKVKDNVSKTEVLNIAWQEGSEFG